MTLSLCMIVKNEADNLPRCLESVKNIVDEMIIVVTGSEDETVNIANSYGAKVYDFPWEGNFSDARNFSLKFATGDWILLMDADDELIISEQNKVLKLLMNENVEAYFFRTISLIDNIDGYEEMQNLNIRLIRNGKGYFFTNPIHEQIYMNIKKISPDAVILNEDIRVNHYGYLNKNIINKDKRNRNIEILKKELEVNPDYSFSLFNLGNEYFAMLDYYKAIEYYEKAYYDFDPNQGFSSKLILKMANCFMHLGKNDDALNLIDKGIKHYPKFTDLIFLKALIFYYENKLTLALDCLKTSIQMGDAPIDLSLIVGCGTYRSYFLLAEIQNEFEDYDSAAENYILSYKFNSKKLVLTKIIKTLCKKNTGRKLLKQQLEALREFDTEDYDNTLAEILLQEKHFDLALEYIQKAEKELKTSANTIYVKGLCKLYLKKYKEAFCIFEKLKDDDKFIAKAVCSQSLCKILDKNCKHAKKLISDGKINQDDKSIKLYKTFIAILLTGENAVLSEDDNESKIYSDMIFEILEILLIVNEFDLFEKALSLLNCISDKTVLLRLAKLYYEENHYNLALQELMRSIKVFDLIDTEGASMLYKLKKMIPC
ncbi:MAG: glycosyltransferase [Candidatus Gastranaerophilales bacterium]|nr:glycosyltransferase [Candidatus Gastranaerophilales bacterium]